MQDNGPVTNREIFLRDDTVIVSKTDLKGRIVFINSEFCEISGYSEQELLNAPHNILRHPDMPKEAFADLWASIKNGGTWEGLIKNRAKNGDHYWVLANVTRVTKDGTDRYISIRTKATQAQIEAIEPIYVRFLAGTARGLRFTHGNVVADSRWNSLITRTRSVSGKMIIGFTLLVMMTVAAGLDGVHWMRASTDALRSVYEDRLVPIVQTTKVVDAVNDGIVQLGMIRDDLARSVPAAKPLTRVRSDLDQIDRQSRPLSEWLGRGDESFVADRFFAATVAITRDFLKPALEAADHSDLESLNMLTRDRLPAAYGRLNEAQHDVFSAELAGAGASFETAAAGLKLQQWIALAILGISVLASVLIGRHLLKSVLAAVLTTESSLIAVSQRDLTHDIPQQKVREFWRIDGALRALKARLAFADAERAELEHLQTVMKNKALRSLMQNLELMIERGRHDPEPAAEAPTPERVTEAGAGAAAPASGGETTPPSRPVPAGHDDLDGLRVVEAGDFIFPFE